MNDLRMPDVNTVLIAGNLTRDPSFRRTTNGTPVANFWIASNRKFKDNTGQWRESVCYVGIVAWYKLAETCAENLKRGSAVLIEGELQSRSLRSEDGRNRNIVEIKARRIQFLNKKDESEEETFEHPVSLDEMNEGGEADDISEPEDVHTSSTESQQNEIPGSVAVQPSDEEVSSVTKNPELTSAEEEKTKETDKPDINPEPEEDNPMKGKFDFGFQNI